MNDSDHVVAMETVSDDVEMKWRDLALQFDGHRMEAMEIIRAMLRGGYEQYAKDFLARPPLSGEAVLASRLAKQGWQGIESAPKERGEAWTAPTVQLWSLIHGGRALQGYWDEDRYAKIRRPFWQFVGLDKTTSRNNQPTRWQPLPAAPSPVGGSES